MTSRQKTALSLLLLVPAPSLGTFFGMVALPDMTAGRLLFALSKVWLLVLPAAWLLLVDRERFSLSPARKGGWLAGILSGVAISAFLLGAFALWGDAVIDRKFLVAALRDVGLGVPWRYALGAFYWITVNAVLEEYVWRWFCVRQCQRLWPTWIAVPASAGFFTLHHVIALGVLLPSATAVVLCSLGVFTGGLVWSACYARYRSIWPGYVSHAIVDLAIFGLGAAMLFG